MKKEISKHIPRRTSPSWVHGFSEAKDAPWWTYYRLWFHHQKYTGRVHEKSFEPETKDVGEYTLEYHILSKENGKWRTGFGTGFRFEKTGGGSFRLNLYFGKLATFYLKANNRFTRKFQKTKEQDPKYWYEGRQYGFNLWGWGDSWLYFCWGILDNTWGPDTPGIEFSSSKFARKLFGYVHSDWTTLDSGTCEIPMPEGNYQATWTKEHISKTYTKKLGKFWEKIRPHKVWDAIKIDIPGGIPVEGKGENSWDCGMDGTFGISSGGWDNIGYAVQEVRESVMRDRKRYGGPHNLPHAMSVKDADEWQKSQ